MIFGSWEFPQGTVGERGSMKGGPDSTSGHVGPTRVHGRFIMPRRAHETLSAQNDYLILFELFFKNRGFA